MANELQTLSFSTALPSAGTVDLNSVTFTHGHFANAAALEGQLQNIVAFTGNVSVTDLGAFTYQIEFNNALANTNVAEITKANDQLTRAGGSVGVDKTVTGVQEVQRITLTGGTADAGDLVINTITVGGGSGMSAAQVETAIEDAGGANKPCSVSGSSGTGPFDVTYNIAENVSDSLLDFTGTTLAHDQPLTWTVTQEGGGGNDEAGYIAGWDRAYTGGTFTITFDSQTTTPIAYNANAATVQAALEALSSIGSGNVVCGGSPHVGPIGGAAAMGVAFTGALANTDVGNLTFDDSSLECDITPSRSTITPGAKTKQRITISADGGSFTLSCASPSFTTGGIAYNADASAVQTALTAALIDTTCTDIGAGVIDIEFNAVAGDAATMTADTAGLTLNNPVTIATTREGSAAGGRSKNLLLLGCG